MKTLVFLLLAVLVVSTSPSPINQKRLLINKPHHEIFRSVRKIRSPQNAKLLFNTKGVTQNPEQTLPSVRKGEYICGNKICSLKPGQVPAGCDGACQYRIH